MPGSHHHQHVRIPRSEQSFLLYTKGDILCGDAVIVSFPRAQALLPLDAVGLGSLRVMERDEDIMTGFNWGRHNDSREENLEEQSRFSRVA